MGFKTLRPEKTELWKRLSYTASRGSEGVELYGATPPWWWVQFSISLFLCPFAFLPLPFTLSFTLYFKRASGPRRPALAPWLPTTGSHFQRIYVLDYHVHCSRNKFPTLILPHALNHPTRPPVRPSVRPPGTQNISPGTQSISPGTQNISPGTQK